jgi:hypothetical protein
LENRDSIEALLAGLGIEVQKRLVPERNQNPSNLSTVAQYSGDYLQANNGHLNPPTLPKNKSNSINISFPNMKKPSLKHRW